MKTHYKRESAISHLQILAITSARRYHEFDLINFRKQYSETITNADPILSSHHILLMNARKEAWEVYFKAYDALLSKNN
jgi:hypothetical protein